jgi:hypothetical protein
MVFKLTTLGATGTECTGSCKSNYHTITTTTAPPSQESECSCIYVCSGYRFVLCFYYFSIRFCNCSDSVLFFCFSVLWLFCTLYNVILNIRSVHRCTYNFHVINCRRIAADHRFWFNPLIRLTVILIYL